MSTPSPSIIPPGILEWITREGIVHRIPLELDYTAGDLGLAEARVSSWVQKEADRYGLVARGSDIVFEVEVEDVGILGFEDSFRRTMVVGTWRLNLGPAPAYSLRFGPAHGLTGRLEHGSISKEINIVGSRAAFATFGRGDHQSLATIEAVYRLAGYDPALSALVYDHDRGARP